MVLSSRPSGLVLVEVTWHEGQLSHQRVIGRRCLLGEGDGCDWQLLWILQSYWALARREPAGCRLSAVGVWSDVGRLLLLPRPSEKGVQKGVRGRVLGGDEELRGPGADALIVATET